MNAPDLSHLGERMDGAEYPRSLATATLFGRERELGEFRGALTEAIAGTGGVVLLGGEAGVGKTRLCREIAAEATARGFAVIWGACFEGIAGRPYEPWPVLIDGLAATLSAADGASLLGPWIDVLARVSPGVDRLAGGVAIPAQLSTRDEEARVAEALSRSLAAYAVSRPLMLVFDDLHWSEAGAIALFGQVARAISGTQILIAATYRDIELSMDHPLSLQLGSLRRERHVRTLSIKPLRLPEMRDFVRELLPNATSPALARAIWNETRGNPFLTEELARHLLEARANGESVSGAGRIDLKHLGIPEGIRQVVALRTSRLSDNARSLLTAAALFAGGVDFALLQSVANLDEAEALDALDELLSAHLLQHVPSSGETYEFVHSIARHAVLAESSPSRRARFHRKVADSILATYPGDSVRFAPELATQFHASASLPGAGAGVVHCVEAARQATSAYARDEAVTFLRMARDLVAPEQAERRRDVLTQLAIAEANALQGKEALATVHELLAMSGSDEVVLASLLARLAATLKDGGVDGQYWAELVAEGLKRCPAHERLTWARLTLLNERFESLSSGQINAARWLGSDPEAVEIARTHGDDEDFSRTLQPFDRFSPGWTNDIVERIGAWTQPPAIIRGLMVAGAGRLYHLAEFARARDHFSHQLDVATEFGSPIGQADAHIRLSIAHSALGELVQAQDHAASAREILTSLLPGHRLHASLAWADAYLAEYLGGDWKPIASLLTGVIRDPALASRAIGLDDAALAALALVRSRQASAARELLDRLTPLIAQVDASIALANGAVAIGATAVWALELAEVAPAFQRAAERLIASGARDFPCSSLELTVARMAALQKDRKSADRWFGEAKRTLARDGQRPLGAIAELDEARMLSKIAPSEAVRIAALLDSARSSFHDLGMHEWAVFCDVSVPRSLRQPKLHATERPAGLTQRELEVLHLVSKGFSDRQIGDELYLSPRTVNAHIRNMLAKTNNANRTELSVWAMANVYGGHDAEA